MLAEEVVALKPFLSPRIKRYALFKLQIAVSASV